MIQPTRSATKMVELIANDVQLRSRLQGSDPVQVLKEVAAQAEQKTWQGDVLLYRIAVGVLGGLTLIAAIGSIVLVTQDKAAPDVLVTLGSTAVGALVGLFAPSPTR